MSYIVYRTNPHNGVVYAYQSESFRDPLTKQPKSRRTYLGRVDPETKLIVPKAEEGKRNRSKLGDSPSKGSMPADTAEVIANLRDEVAALKRENLSIREQLKKQESRANMLIQQLQTAIDAYSHNK